MDNYRMWIILKKRLPHAVCWRIIRYRGQNAMAVWMISPHTYVGQPVIIFDCRTLEPIGEGFL